jgi:DNA-binding XRE family transcriptional regulator
VDEPGSAAAARLALGKKLAGLRRDHGRTQHQLAELITGYSRATVADAERGRRHVKREFWTTCDQVLNAGGTLVDEYDRVEMQAAVAAATADSNPGTSEALTHRCPHCRRPISVLTIIAGSPGGNPAERVPR